MDPRTPKQLIVDNERFKIEGKVSKSEKEMIDTAMNEGVDHMDLVLRVALGGNPDNLNYLKYRCSFLHKWARNKFYDHNFVEAIAEVLIKRHPDYVNTWYEANVICSNDKDEKVKPGRVTVLDEAYTFGNIYVAVFLLNHKAEVRKDTDGKAVFYINQKYNQKFNPTFNAELAANRNKIQELAETPIPEGHRFIFHS